MPFNQVHTNELSCPEKRLTKEKGNHEVVGNSPIFRNVTWFYIEFIRGALKLLYNAQINNSCYANNFKYNGSGV
jgi:hypothetical protein